MGDNLLEQPTVKCPSCESVIRAADESGLVNVLQEHLYEEHALEMPRERVREYVSARLKDFNGYNARPISGA
jgi:predicted small metal-binding protein